MMNSNLNNKGFTLLGLIIIMGVIGTLFMMSEANFNMYENSVDTKVEQITTDILSDMISYYYLKYDKLPISSKDVELEELSLYIESKYGVKKDEQKLRYVDINALKQDNDNTLEEIIELNNNNNNNNINTKYVISLSNDEGLKNKVFIANGRDFNGSIIYE